MLAALAARAALSMLSALSVLSVLSVCHGVGMVGDVEVPIHVYVDIQHNKYFRLHVNRKLETISRYQYNK